MGKYKAICLKESKSIGAFKTQAEAQVAATNHKKSTGHSTTVQSPVTTAGEFLSSEKMKPQGITVAQLAKAVGMKPDGVRKVLDGKTRFTGKTSHKIGKALKVSAKKIMTLQANHEVHSSKFQTPGLKGIKPLL